MHFREAIYIMMIGSHDDLMRNGPLSWIIPRGCPLPSSPSCSSACARRGVEGYPPSLGLRDSLKAALIYMRHNEPFSPGGLLDWIAPGVVEGLNPWRDEEPCPHPGSAPMSRGPRDPVDAGAPWPTRTGLGGVCGAWATGPGAGPAPPPRGPGAPGSRRRGGGRDRAERVGLSIATQCERPSR